ncbi:SET domain-containing protein [Sinosporangium album]|uniref:SET domain-containing protein n=1 Tax=Sinosporangium album TaxID=504805 RepID=A0A1G7QUL3_9ACTN|nr:SET domain-containing protein [Sinosporangium album]SDG02154.1 SET domain-containing protein [Sinosporangium album]
MLNSALYPGFSAIAGTGLIALRDIRQGTVVWGPCAGCRTWAADEQYGMPSAVLEWLDEFGYRLSDRSLILPCGGAHLFNHSCEAAVLDHGLAGGIAVRDIHAGEEVTCDYRTFRYDDPWEFACACGSRECARVVRPGSGGSGGTGGTVGSAGRAGAAGPAGEPPREVVSAWRRRMAPALRAAERVPQEIPLRRGSVVVVERHRSAVPS